MNGSPLLISLSLTYISLSLVQTDVVLSYLPLAHIFEQQSELLMLSVGASIGFYQGDVRHLLEDMETLMPTIFIGVPRVFSKLETKVVDTVENGNKALRYLFNRAYRTQVANVKKGRPRSKFWDTIVFSMVKKRLLPNVRLVITGSAPMSAQTNDFLKVHCVLALRFHSLSLLLLSCTHA